MLTAALPDDPLTLKALIGELAVQLAGHEARVAEQQDQLQQRAAEVTAVRDALAVREREIARLELVIAVLRRAQFGRRSERLARNLAQCELALEELEAAQAEAVAVPPTVSPTPRRSPTRQPLPSHLPRETVRQPPALVASPEGDVSIGCEPSGASDVTGDRTTITRMTASGRTRSNGSRLRVPDCF
jgi:hypothetical protein